MCGKKFKTYKNITRPNRGKYCSKKCYQISGLGRKQSKEQIRKRISHYLNEKHWAWKGNNVSYGSLHSWIKRNLGTPTKCEHCGQDGLTGKKIHWANKSGQYKRDLSDWLRLCVSCHREYDHISFYKGFTPWNKNTKGICKAWNKGLKMSTS